jgi:hypothetical protein
MPFRVYQSLWAMRSLPFGSDEEWPVPDKIARIVDAGFDGIDIAWTPTLPSEEAVRCAQDAGLDYGLVCFPRDTATFAPLLETFAALDHAPRHLNLQPVPRTSEPAEGAALLREWIAMARAAGFRPLVETHRDRMTTDLRFTLQLLDLVPEMRLVADLSHYVVGQEFAWPVGDEDDLMMRRIVERADMFHGRVATREQIQISISWEYHRPWLDLFLGWWEHGFRSWRERAGADDELVFVTELGPPRWYSITGPDGYELADRWAESLQLKNAVHELWATVERS